MTHTEALMRQVLLEHAAGVRSDTSAMRQFRRILNEGDKMTEARMREIAREEALNVFNELLKVAEKELGIEDYDDYYPDDADETDDLTGLSRMKEQTNKW